MLEKVNTNSEILIICCIAVIRIYMKYVGTFYVIDLLLYNLKKVPLNYVVKYSFLIKHMHM